MKRQSQSSLYSFFNKARKTEELLDDVVNNEKDDVNNEKEEAISTIVIDEQSNTAVYPSVWSVDQYKNFCIKNPWLEAASGKLGCKSCREINLNGLGAFKEQGVSFSVEWCETRIGPSINEKRSTQLTNLRVKIKKHAESKAHQLAEEIKKQSKNNVVQELLQKECKEEREATARVFRTVYYLAKSDRPFSDHEGLIELQQHNGVNLGLTLHSRYSATKIIEHVASQMKNKMVQHIIESKAKLSVLVDESSTLGRKSVLIVYIGFILRSEQIFMFLDLVELKKQCAEYITQALIETLNKHGFSTAYLSENWVSFVSDGASVMIGKKSGVASRISSTFPAILCWHCMSHRLELAVGDALKSVTATNYFQSFLECIYSLYSQSNKNQEELREAAAELDVQLLKIGKIFDVRWVASSYRTVAAVFNNFSALHLHFCSAAEDVFRDGRTRQKFRGLADKLGSFQFLKNLGIMYDCLKELAHLSLELQRRDISLKNANEQVRRTIRVLESFKADPAEKSSEVLDAVANKNFRNIQLKSSKVPEIDTKQFLQSLIDNLKTRLLDDDIDDTSSSVLVDLQVLDRSSWPPDPSIRYGENAIKRLCTRFSLDLRQAISGMRKYVDASDILPEDLQELQRLVKTFPCSTAECERGFHAMNLIMTKLRSTLLVQNIGNLMMVKINGPPVNQFHPENYVSSWLTNHRSANDNQSRKVRNKKDNEHPLKDLWALL